MSDEEKPLPESIEQYLRFIQTEKRLSTRSCMLYRHELKRLFTLAQGQNLQPEQASSSHIRQWIGHMHQQGQQPRSISLSLSIWRGWYAWLGQAHNIGSNPITGIRAPKKKQTLPKALAVDQAIQLADFARQLSHKAPENKRAFALRDAAIIELLYGAGLRVSELTGLDLTASAQAKGWIDISASEAHVLGKGAKWRLAPIGRQALSALGAYLQVREQLLPPDKHENALFLGPRGGRITALAVWKSLQAISLQAGLPVAVHPHMLRHSFASHILQSSGDLRAVQELLGHANISTTQIYTRLDFQHLAQVYDAAHPRAKKPPTPNANKP